MELLKLRRIIWAQIIQLLNGKIMVKRIEKRQKYILDIIKYVISRVLVYIIISNLEKVSIFS